MDLYEIILTHNKAWSTLEIGCFLMLFSCVSIVVSVLTYRKKILVSQAISILLVVVFLGIVFASTVFTRNPSEKRKYCLQLFWSWREVFLEHSEALLQENLLNCILLSPLGCLLPFIFHKHLRWFQAFFYGFFVSFVIELCQLVFKRGLFEWDDMIHNALGCMIGCMIVQEVWKIKKKVENKFLFSKKQI